MRHFASRLARLRAKSLAAISPFHTLPPMLTDTDLDDLAAFLVRNSKLSSSEARRLIDEVMHFLDELPDDYVRRRHFALQAQGLNNAGIFARLTLELRNRRFRAPDYTERQIRRIIYG
jgi:hypothetical protein